MPSTRSLLLVGALGAAALTAGPAGAAASNGDLVVFTRGGDLFVVSPSGGEPRRVVDTPDLVEDEPSWSPDGTRLRFVRAATGQEDGEVWERVLATGEERRLTPGGVLVDDVDFSPDSDRVVYTRRVPTNPKRNQAQQDVFVAKGDFTGERNLSADPAYDGNPDFGPGGLIAFDSLRDGSNTAVYTVDVDTGAAPARLPVSDAQDGGRFPSWSPDGSTLVYMEYVSPTRNWGLRLHRVGTTTETRLTDGGANQWHPEFSPAGDAVVFAHWDGSPKTRFHVRSVQLAAPQAVTVLTEEAGPVSSQPSWRPVSATQPGGGSPSPTPAPCLLPPPLTCS